jgi:hypothetical protein
LRHAGRRRTLRRWRGVDLSVHLRKRNEAIAVSGESLDVTWGIGVIAERVAQLHDRLVQAAIEVDIGTVAP